MVIMKCKLVAYLVVSYRKSKRKSKKRFPQQLLAHQLAVSHVMLM